MNCQGALCFGDWCFDLFVKDIVPKSNTTDNMKCIQKKRCFVSALYQKVTYIDLEKKEMYNIVTVKGGDAYGSFL